MEKLKTLLKQKKALFAIAAVGVAVVVGVAVSVVGKNQNLGDTVTKLVRKVVPPKTLADYADYLTKSEKTSHTVSVIPADVLGIKGKLVIKTVPTKGDKYDSSIDLTIDELPLGEELNNTVLKNIQLSTIITNDAFYLRVKIGNIKEFLSTLGIPPYYSFGYNLQAALDGKWIYFPSTVVDEFAQVSETESVKPNMISPQEVEKLIKYVSKSFIIKDKTQKGDVIELKTYIDRDLLIEALEELKADKELLDKLEMSAKDIQKAIEGLKETDKDALASLIFVWYLDTKKEMVTGVAFEVKSTDAIKNGIKRTMEEDKTMEKFYTNMLDALEKEKYVRLMELKVKDLGDTTIEMPSDYVNGEELIQEFFLFMLGGNSGFGNNGYGNMPMPTMQANPYMGY